MSTARISLPKLAPDVYRALAALDRSVEFDQPLRELIKIRVSQLNGCAYCIDLHAREARAGGEQERRIWALSAWRETPFFDARERAALALAEAMTLLPGGPVSDEVYAEAARCFPDAELAQLFGAIISINAWNRVGVGSSTPLPLEAPAQVGT